MIINVATRLFFLRKYSWPYAVIKDPSLIYFWKKSWKNWVKIEKNGYFQKLLHIALQKFPALRYFQTLRWLGLDIFFQTRVICKPLFIRKTWLELIFQKYAFEFWIMSVFCDRKAKQDPDPQNWDRDPDRHFKKDLRSRSRSQLHDRFGNLFTYIRYVNFMKNSGNSSLIKSSLKKFLPAFSEIVRKLEGNLAYSGKITTKIIA